MDEERFSELEGWTPEDSSAKISSDAVSNTRPHRPQGVAAWPRMRELRRHRFRFTLFRHGGKASRMRSGSWTARSSSASISSTLPTPMAAARARRSSDAGGNKGRERSRSASFEIESVQPRRGWAERPRLVAPPCQALGRRKLDATRRRAARPLSRARARPRDTARGDARRARRSRAPGQSALYRREQLRSLEAHPCALAERQARAPPLRVDPERLQLALASNKSSKCFRYARTKSSASHRSARSRADGSRENTAILETYPKGSRVTLRPEPYDHLVNEKIFSALRRFRKAAEDRGVSMGSLAMAWVLANPLTTAIITGPRRPEHLDMAEAALDVELSEDDRAALTATFTP